MKEPLRIRARRAVSRGRLKYVADLLKSLAVLMIGVGLVTPAVTGKALTGVAPVWEALALLLIVLGLILTPES